MTLSQTHDQNLGSGANERAEAKLTLTLKMVGIRSDGYHLIESEMVSLSFADSLAIQPSETTSLSINGPSGASLDSGPQNLVIRALKATQRTARVELEKKIPLGAGLGGGSSDAAAILRWANEHDPQVAARLGADVAFCVRGGRAMVSGIGEIVEPVEFRQAKYTLVTPPIHVNTASVYRIFDEMPADLNRQQYDNDLQLSALAVAPELESWRRMLSEWTGMQPCLAGSGSTWFVQGHHEEPDWQDVENTSREKLFGLDVEQLQKARWVRTETTPGF